MKLLNRNYASALAFLIFALFPLSPTKAVEEEKSSLGLDLSSGARMTFERVTEMEINTGGSMDIRNGHLQYVVIRAIVLSDPWAKASFDACERSARLAMAFPEKYTLVVYGYSYDNNSTATTSTIYTPSVSYNGAGRPNVVCTLKVKE